MTKKITFEDWKKSVGGMRQILDHLDKNLPDFVSRETICPDCGKNKVIKNGATRDKNSPQFKCLNKSCARKSFSIAHKKD